MSLTKSQWSEKQLPNTERESSEVTAVQSKHKHSLNYFLCSHSHFLSLSLSGANEDALKLKDDPEPLPAPQTTGHRDGAKTQCVSGRTWAWWDPHDQLFRWTIPFNIQPASSENLLIMHAKLIYIFIFTYTCVYDTHHDTGVAIRYIAIYTDKKNV